MCPGCLTTMALVAAGVGSAGGLASLLVTKVRAQAARKELPRNPAATPQRHRETPMTTNQRVEPEHEEVKVRRVQMIAVMAGLLCSLAASAENPQTPKVMRTIEPLPRDLEIQLALSGLPPHLRDGATVYVLNPYKGFEVARNGTNGFHALVARTGDDAFRGAWPLAEYRDDILYPISFDKAGGKAQMQVFLDAAEMQAKGVPADELKRIMKDRLKSGHYKAPERAGISYMLSPVLRTYYDPEESDRVVTVNLPHVMYYAPGVSNEDIGAKFGGVSPFVILPGHHGYIIQPLGLTERAVINKEYEAMLERLCGIKDVWCLPK